MSGFATSSRTTKDKIQPHFTSMFQQFDFLIIWLTKVSVRLQPMRLKQISCPI